MQTKLLKSIVEILTNKQSALIVDLLVGKKDVNEFFIAKKMGLTINQTRNILYKLSDFGLVSFIRKKDKRKGWYIYFWTLNVIKSLDLLEQKLKEELDKVEIQLRNRKEKRYYLCKTCNIEVTEEAALLNDFICSECEEVYGLAESEEIIRRLEKEISNLNKEINLISEEKEKEEEKTEKKKTAKSKRAEKKKEKGKKSAKKIKIKEKVNIKKKKPAVKKKLKHKKKKN